MFQPDDTVDASSSSYGSEETGAFHISQADFLKTVLLASLRLQ